MEWIWWAEGEKGEDAGWVGENFEILNFVLRVLRRDSFESLLNSI